MFGRIELIDLVRWVFLPALILVLVIVDKKRRERGKPPILTTGALAGALIGGLIGFLLRPAAPFVGQLPFVTVITRGSNLRGLDSLLISIAETSFNYMLVGAIIGGVGVAIAGEFLRRGRQVPTTTTAVAESKTPSHSAPATPKQVELNQSPEQVVNVLGPPEKTVNLGAKVIYIYKDMKVVFIDGKVSDVQ